MSDPLGVILAGGLGRRMGGSKATASLGGRPLISYPLDALRAALPEVVVLAKAKSELPRDLGVEVWIEPDREHHPLIGLRAALALAGARPVLVCAADLPFVRAELVRRLALVDGIAVASYGASIQPLLGRYDASAAARLPVDPSGPVRDAVAGLGPQLVEVDDPTLLFNVNSPEDLWQAAAILGRGGP